MTIDYPQAFDLLEAYTKAADGLRRGRVRGPVRRRRRARARPVRASARRAQRAAGILARGGRARSATRRSAIERHWVSGDTVLAAWHASWTPGRGRREGPAGRLPLRRGGGGRAHRAPAAVDSGSRAPRGLERRTDGGRGLVRRRVSDFDEQELRNALDQVRREVQQRYDFKGATVELTPGEDRARPRDRRRVPRRGRSGTSSSRRRSGAACRSRSSTGARWSRPAATRSARSSA